MSGAVMPSSAQALVQAARSPLVSRHALDDVFAWCPEGAVSVREFIADAQAFADRLPEEGQVINLCEDRYRFAVGFAAGLLRGKTSLQPSSQAAHSLRQVAADFPGSVCLVDAGDAPAGLPVLVVPARAGLGGPLPDTVPQIDDAQVAAILFTSGSTGRPQPHPKRWGYLVRNGQAESAALGLSERPHALVGTVPVQHSYGFESTFLLALHGGCHFWSGKPFYPQDIADALAAVPAPRMLVTTPYHLANWLSAGLPIAPLERVLSATAPLSDGLARDAEAACGGQVHEIYGSTESSALASRRTLDGPQWTLMGEARLRLQDDVALAHGGHVEGSVPLSDVLELLPDHRFLLHGRLADLVNIAGKRTSLAYLNQQLLAIDGVVEAAFYLPDSAETPAGVTRLVAFAVAPGCHAPQLLAALRERVDAIFLPRPLVLVPELPRNATGKVMRDTLGMLYRREVLHER